MSALSLVVIAVIAVGRILRAILLFLFAILVAIVLVAYATARSLFTVRWGVILTVAALVFGAGFAAKEFQEEAMIGLDIAYECGVFPAAQLTVSFLRLTYARPVDFVHTEWNRMWFGILDTLGQVIDDLRMLIRLGEIASESELFQSIDSEIFGIAGIFGEVLKFATQIIVDGVTAIGVFLVCFGDVIVRFFSALLASRTLISQNCTACAMDPPTPSFDGEGECTLRQVVFAGAVPNCTECHDFVVEGFNCIGGLVGDILDISTAGLIPRRIPARIARAIACLLNHFPLFKPALWIAQGIFDFIFSGGTKCFDPFGSGLTNIIADWFLLSDCGRPDPGTNCDIPGPINKNGQDVPVGLIPCFGEFIRAITDDQIDNFFVLLFGFIFDFIQEVIDFVLGIVACFELPAFDTCLQRWPIGPGSPGTDPGVCFFDTGDSGIDLIIPDGGIGDCFAIVGTCLAELPGFSVLESTGVLGFLFDDFWRIGLDMPVCTFAIMIICGNERSPCPNRIPIDDPLDFLNDPVCIFDCIDDNVPTIGFLFGILADLFFEFGQAFDFIFEFLQELIEGGTQFILTLIKVLDCITQCSPTEIVDGGIGDCLNSGGESSGCLDRKRGVREVPSQNQTAEARETWRALLDSNQIYTDTVCGEALHSMLPNEMDVRQWADYAVYSSCFGVFSLAARWKERCPPGTVDVPGLLRVDTFAECVHPLASCIRDYQANVTSQEKRGVPGQEPLDPTLRLAKSLADGLNFTKAAWKEKMAGWSLSQHALWPLWADFKNTTFYALTAEFVREWQGIRAAYAPVEETTPLIDSTGGTDAENDTALTTIGGATARRYAPMRVHEQLELKQLYADYVNAFLWNYQDTTRLGALKAPERFEWNAPKTLAEYQLRAPTLSARTLRMLPASEEGGYVPITFEDLGAKADSVARLAGKAWEVKEVVRRDWTVLARMWKVVDERYSIRYWPSVRGAAGFLHVFQSGDPQLALRWARGDERFLVDEGMVDETRFEAVMSERDVLNEGSLMDRAVGGTHGLHDGRRRVYRPFFPIRAEWGAAVTVWPANATALVSGVHAQKEEDRARRTRKGHVGAVRANIIGSGDFNQVIYDFVDAIVALFSDVKRWLSDAVARAIDFFRGSDLASFFFDDVGQFAVDYFACALPENIDGSELFSPFCLGFLPGDYFSLLAPVPNSVFPVQINWPESLVVDDCVKAFTGVTPLEDFEFSDNCPDPGGSTGSLCPACDYCARSYRSCKIATCLLPGGERVEDEDLCDELGGTEIGDGLCELSNGDVLDVAGQCGALGGNLTLGVGDVLDTFLYFLAVAPRTLDTGLSGGLSIKGLESAWNLVIGFFLVPSLLYPIGTFPLYLTFQGLSHVSIWSIGAVFDIEFFDSKGEIPIAALAIIALGLLLFFVSELGMFFAVLVTVTVLLTIGWFAGLFFTLPTFADTLNIIQGLTTVVEFLDEFPLLFFINFQPLLARLEQFNFGSGPIPPQNSFCAVWNFSDLGLLVIVVFFVPFVARLAYRWALAIAIFILDLLLLIGYLWLHLRTWLLRRDVDEAEDEADTMRDKVKALEARIESMRRAFMTTGGAPVVADAVAIPIDNIHPAAVSTTIVRREERRTTVADEPAPPPLPPQQQQQFKIAKKKKRTNADPKKD